jgi:tetratricopeptide (TPR) repeat protein
MTARIFPLLLFATCLFAHATPADELVLQAKLAKAQGDSVGAQSLLTTALRLEPQNASANFEMGLISQEAGNYADAVGYYNRADAAGMADASLYYNRALCRLKLREVKDARADNLLAQKSKPDDADVLIQAATVESAAGDQTKACTYLHGALGCLGITPTHLRQIAILAENCGDGELALQAVAGYLRLRADDTTMQRLRARVLYKLGKYADSIQAWQELATVTGEKDDWLGGIKAARDGSDGAAELALAKEIYQRFGDFTYLCELGNKRLQAGDYPGAEQAFALLKPTDSLAALWNLAVAQEKQGKLDAARASWQLYMTISTDKTARAKVEKHLAGLDAEPKTQPEPIHPKQLEPSNQTRGMALAQEAGSLCSAGKYAEALPKWQEAINLLPEMTDLVYNMAGTLEKLDRLEDAKAVWEHYLTLDITPQRKNEIERHLGDLNRELERRAQEQTDTTDMESKTDE